MTMMISRRALLGSLALGGSATLLPRAAFAWTNAEALYPATYAFIKGFVDRRELAGAIAAIGKDRARASRLWIRSALWPRTRSGGSIR